MKCRCVSRWGEYGQNAVIRISDMLHSIKEFQASMVYHSVASVMSDSLWPHGLYPARLLCPWDSPGKNTGVGSHSLLQGIFLTQELNPGLLHCRWILYHLSHQRSPPSRATRPQIPHIKHLLFWPTRHLLQKATPHSIWVCASSGSHSPLTLHSNCLLAFQP